MKFKLRKLEDQVIVITGASSGIGLATAQMADARGAKLVLCSRNKPELERISSGFKSAIAVECDVSDPEAVRRVADEAIKKFGRIDTWVNNAGITIYGKLDEVPLEDKRRLFDVNFWGVVHGCRAALPILKKTGGAIINIGSILSDRAIPIQGIYAASKHAVKAYTDALRMELEAAGDPVSVSLVKPAAIDTPYTEHAVNFMPYAPVHRPPVYAPEVVAQVILDCAEHPRRDIYVGGSAKVFSLLETFMPRLADVLMEKGMMQDRQSDPEIHRKQSPSLHTLPAREGQVHGDYRGHVFRRSAYTSAVLHPGAAALIATGLGLITAAGIGYMQSRRGESIAHTVVH